MHYSSLYSMLMSTISSLTLHFSSCYYRSRHVDEISYMVVAFLNYILKGCYVNFGYNIIHHMLSNPGMVNRSFPFGYFIIKIFKFFQVPIDEPTFDPTKPIGDELIYGLGFE